MGYVIVPWRKKVFHFLYLFSDFLFQTCGFVWYWSALIGRKGWCWKEWRIYGNMWFFRHTKFNLKKPPFSDFQAALGDEVWDIYVASIRVMALVRSFWGRNMDWFDVTFSMFKNLDILWRGARHPSNIAGWNPLSIATLLRLGRSWRKCHQAPAAQNSGTLESSEFRVGRSHQKHHQPNHPGNAPGWTKFDPSKVHMEEVEMFHVFFL